MEKQDNSNKDELLNSFNTEVVLEIINDYLPKSQKISKEKGIMLVHEAKKLFFNLKNTKLLEKDIILAKDFFCEGKKDLIRSKRSYSEQDFSDSIYHLQQATEKIMKSYGLAQGIFSKKDLRDINHQTPKAFIKMVQEEKIQIYLQSLKRMHPNLNIDMSGLKKVVETKDKELALLTIEQINVLLNLSKKIEKALDKTNLDKTLKNILPDLAKAQGKKVTYPSFSIIKSSTIFIKMYLIAAITYPHEAFTRYPDRGIKPSQYIEDLGIVKAAPQIFEILDETLDFLEKFIDWKNKF